MKDAHNHELLSYGDALFLYLEREGMPLNVATVAQFEGHIDLEDCIAFVASKLPLLPRYRQRVAMPPMNVGLPIWEYDPRFNIRKHVTEVRLPRATETELKRLAGRILSANMDRSRPLWDFTLVHGLKGGNTALIVRVHHCLADGISGVGMMATLMDSTPARPVLPKVAKFISPRPRDRSSLLLDGLVTSCFSGVQRLLTAQAELLAFAHRLAQNSHSSGDNGQADPDSLPSLPPLQEFTRRFPEFATAAERMPFNVVCRGPQQFQWATLPLSEIKAVKRRYGATVNDVFLTVITSALRRYVALHRAPTAGRFLRVIVPVSIRGKDSATELGNRITFLPVTVPILRSDRRLIVAVRERTRFLKDSHVADLVGLAGTMLGTIPTALQAALGPLISSLPIPAGNIICTQVPGPREPLYLMGHRMLSCYPYVPLGGEFGMNCAVLTYNDIAHFGFSGDVHAVPDLDVLPKLLLTSFEGLKKASGIGRRRLRAPLPPRKAPTAVPAPAMTAVAGD